LYLDTKLKEIWQDGMRSGLLYIVADGHSAPVTASNLSSWRCSCCKIELA